MKIFFALENLVDPTPFPQGDVKSTTSYLTLTFIILGGLALLMLVIAGLRYIIAAGNAEKMAEARRMIIYTAVGLVMANLTASIVGVVAGRLK